MSVTSCSLLALALFAGPSEIDRAQSIIHEGLESKDPKIRLQAVVATSMVGRSRQVNSRLTDELQKDTDVQVRVAAANALADLKDPQSIPALRSALHKDEVPEVALASAKALYAMNDVEGKEALEEVFDRKISGSSNALRKQAREFFSHFHTLRSSFVMVFSEGVGFIPLPGVGAGFSAITELLTDPDLSTRATVVLLLGKNHDASATDVLKRALQDKDWSVRAAAAQCIAQAARKDLVPNLVPLLNDSKEKVRFRAAGAYLHLTANQPVDSNRSRLPRKSS